MTTAQDIERLLPVIDLRIAHADAALAEADQNLRRIEAHIARLRAAPDQTTAHDLQLAATGAKHRRWARGELARLAGPLALARAERDARQGQASREHARRAALVAIQQGIRTETRRAIARDENEALITRALLR